MGRHYDPRRCIMLVRTSTAVWEGGLKNGKGKMKIGKGDAFDGSYTFASRFATDTGTNPEELIGAAHAGCFSMALALMLDREGYKPERIATTARVKVEKVGDGYRIMGIDLDTEGLVPSIDEARFREKAEVAKKVCPVSVALASVDIRLEARLAKAKAA
jgi:osmotically inducible protein OsmC